MNKNSMPRSFIHKYYSSETIEILLNFNYKLERRIKMKTFEQKLTEILARTLSGEVTPVEYALSNEPSETKGKVNQFVTFKYEVDEPSEKDGPQLKK